MAAVLLCGALLPSARADVSAEQARRALDRGVRTLKKRQARDGTWAERNGQRHAGGVTCLVTLALLQAGESLSSPSMQAALGHLRRQRNELVYVVALKLMALAKADPQKYRREIDSAARWLIKVQRQNGLWSYDGPRGTYDHSNTQFALLGLHAAAQAGVNVPTRVWKRAQTQLLRNQKTDGGWAYRHTGNSYGSMTAAGAADLIILGSSTATPQERGFRDGAAPGCGKYKGSRPLINALDWLRRNFRADENPQHGTRWLYYWLYAVERCGILSGRRYFGRHDWYREGAEYLVRAQNRDGTWGNSLVDTAFGVLFLAKGRKPLLVQKLKWSRDESWNPDRNDLEHLTAFIGDKLGEPTAWQVIEFDAPLEEWLAAPLLYFHGHEFPRWNVRQRDKIRRYIEQGGTLLAEACCGREEFRAGFEQFVADTFPAVPLRELDPGHPVYSAFYDLKPAGLMGLDIGCRTSVLYSPNDLSCLWEQGDLPVLSEQALRLGTNIAAFAIGRQALRDRLDVIILPEEQQLPPGPPAGDALRLGQLVYDGDWRPDPQALVHFAEFLRDNVHLDVVTRYQPVRLTDNDLYTCPFLFMTGHYGFGLSDREIAGLAAHLQRGGFLLAEACCGRAAFDSAFRALVKRAFPRSELKRLPDNHPIHRGEPGFRLETVGYKPAALAENPELRKPELWGLELEGRLALVYSPYSIGCGLDGHVCYNCRGYLDEDARKLTANVVLYALTH
ncbi:MAG: DUF4159 domain-containing protein [Phycisphaerae bacterium]